jgi:hypothetical protein
LIKSSCGFSHSAAILRKIEKINKNETKEIIIEEKIVDKKPTIVYTEEEETKTSDYSKLNGYLRKRGEKGLVKGWKKRYLIIF